MNSSKFKRFYKLKKIEHTYEDDCQIFYPTEWDEKYLAYKYYRQYCVHQIFGTANSYVPMAPLYNVDNVIHTYDNELEDFEIYHNHLEFIQAFDNNQLEIIETFDNEFEDIQTYYNEHFEDVNQEDFQSIDSDYEFIDNNSDTAQSGPSEAIDENDLPCEFRSYPPPRLTLGRFFCNKSASRRIKVVKRRKAKQIRTIKVKCVNKGSCHNLDSIVHSTVQIEEITSTKTSSCHLAEVRIISQTSTEKGDLNRIEIDKICKTDVKTQKTFSQAVSWGLSKFSSSNPTIINEQVDRLLIDNPWVQVPTEDLERTKTVSEIVTCDSPKIISRIETVSTEAENLKDDHPAVHISTEKCIPTNTIQDLATTWSKIVKGEKHTTLVPSKSVKQEMDSNAEIKSPHVKGSKTFSEIVSCGLPKITSGIQTVISEAEIVKVDHPSVHISTEKCIPSNTIQDLTTTWSKIVKGEKHTTLVTSKSVKEEMDSNAEIKSPHIKGSKTFSEIVTCGSPKIISGIQTVIGEAEIVKVDHPSVHISTEKCIPSNTIQDLATTWSKVVKGEKHTTLVPSKSVKQEIDSNAEIKSPHIKGSKTFSEIVSCGSPKIISGIQTVISEAEIVKVDQPSVHISTEKCIPSNTIQDLTTTWSKIVKGEKHKTLVPSKSAKQEMDSNAETKSPHIKGSKTFSEIVSCGSPKITSGIQTIISEAEIVKVDHPSVHISTEKCIPSNTIQDLTTTWSKIVKGEKHTTLVTSKSVKEEMDSNAEIKSPHIKGSKTFSEIVTCGSPKIISGIQTVIGEAEIVKVDHPSVHISTEKCIPSNTIQDLATTWSKVVKGEKHTTLVPSKSVKQEIDSNAEIKSPHIKGSKTFSEIVSCGSPKIISGIQTVISEAEIVKVDQPSVHISTEKCIPSNTIQDLTTTWSKIVKGEKHKTLVPSKSAKQEMDSNAETKSPHIKTSRKFSEIVTCGSPKIISGIQTVSGEAEIVKVDHPSVHISTEKCIPSNTIQDLAITWSKIVKGEKHTTLVPSISAKQEIDSNAETKSPRIKGAKTFSEIVSCGSPKIISVIQTVISEAETVKVDHPSVHISTEKYIPSNTIQDLTTTWSKIVKGEKHTTLVPSKSVKQEMDSNAETKSSHLKTSRTFSEIVTCGSPKIISGIQTVIGEAEIVKVDHPSVHISTEKCIPSNTIQDLATTWNKIVKGEKHTTLVPSKSAKQEMDSNAETKSPHIKTSRTFSEIVTCGSPKIISGIQTVIGEAEIVNVDHPSVHISTEKCIASNTIQGLTTTWSKIVKGEKHTTLVPRKSAKQEMDSNAETKSPHIKTSRTFSEIVTCGLPKIISGIQTVIGEAEIVKVDHPSVHISTEKCIPSNTIQGLTTMWSKIVKGEKHTTLVCSKSGKKEIDSNVDTKSPKPKKIQSIMPATSQPEQENDSTKIEINDHLENTIECTTPECKVRPKQKKEWIVKESTRKRSKKSKNDQ